MFNRRNRNAILDECLKKIEGVSSNESFKYIVSRINGEKYQGHTSVNHNRITTGKVTSFLETFKNNEFIEIPKGDAGKGNFDINNYKKFDALVKNFVAKTGQGTQNTIRKNSSPDFARYGFIERYLDAGRGKVLVAETGERIPTLGKRMFWKISSIGEEFLGSNEVKKQEILSDEANRLHEKIITVTYEVLKIVEKLSFFEFMMFVNKPDQLSIEDDVNLSVELINDFRKAGRIEQESIGIFLSKLDMKEQTNINKKYKFDYGNWKNDTQQLVDTFRKMFIFKINQNSSFNVAVDANGKKIRNKAIYADYNTTHTVTKMLGYEYHHIVPLAKAKTEAQLKLIDSENNLIYLDAGIHAIFSQMGNPYIVFNRYASDFVELSSIYGELFRIPKEKYEYDLLEIPRMKSHNKLILKSLGY